MGNNTITYSKLESILTDRLNELAQKTEKTRENAMRKRLKECNKYYLPEHRYKMIRIGNRLCIRDSQGETYTDIEETIKGIEKTIGLC